MASLVNGQDLCIGVVVARNVIFEPASREVAFGGTATWVISLINSGNVPLSSLFVTDPQAPDCARNSTQLAGDVLAPNEAIIYLCSRKNITANFTNIATGCGLDTVTGIQVCGVAEASVVVLTSPSITVLKEPKSQNIAFDGTAQWNITVLNSGDVPLSSISVTDPQSPTCARTASQPPFLNVVLQPGQRISYSCSRVNVSVNFTNIATGCGVDIINGNQVCNETQAVVTTTTPPVNTLTIKKTPKCQKVKKGGTAQFTITIRNIGPLTLTSVVLSDPQVRDCNRLIGELLPDSEMVIKCTLHDVYKSFVNVATVNGTDPFGRVLRASAMARVVVEKKVKKDDNNKHSTHSSYGSKLDTTDQYSPLSSHPNDPLNDNHHPNDDHDNHHPNDDQDNCDEDQDNHHPNEYQGSHH